VKVRGEGENLVTPDAVVIAVEEVSQRENHRSKLPKTMPSTKSNATLGSRCMSLDLRVLLSVTGEPAPGAGAMIVEAISGGADCGFGLEGGVEVRVMISKSEADSLSAPGLGPEGEAML